MKKKQGRRRNVSLSNRRKTSKDMLGYRPSVPLLISRMQPLFSVFFPFLSFLSLHGLRAVDYLERGWVLEVGTLFFFSALNKMGHILYIWPRLAPNPKNNEVS